MSKNLTISFRVSQDRHDELAHLALVETVHQRKRIGVSDIIRVALDRAYPPRPETDIVANVELK